MGHRHSSYIANQCEELKNMETEELEHFMETEFSDEYDLLEFDNLKTILQNDLKQGEELRVFTEDEKTERNKITKAMQKKCVDYFIKHGNHVDYFSGGFQSNKRELGTLLLFGDDNKTLDYNIQLKEDLTDADPEKLHEILIDIMDRMVSLDIDQVSQYSDQEFLDHFEEFMPAVMMGMEAENLLSYLKQSGCPVSPEEEKNYKELKTKYNDFGMQIYNRIDILSSPCYQDIDLENMGEVNFKLLEDMMNLQSADNEVSGFANALYSGYLAKSTECFHKIDKVVRESGEIEGSDSFFLSPVPSYAPAFADHTVDENGDLVSYSNSLEYIQDLKDGKKVYGYKPMGMNEKNQHPMHAFKMNQNGYVYEVPCPEKPSIFDYIGHFFSKLFGGDGNRKVLDYQNREVNEALADDANRDKVPTNNMQAIKDFVKQKKREIEAKNPQPKEKTEEKLEDLGNSKEEVMENLKAKFETLKDLQARNEILKQKFAEQNTGKTEPEKVKEPEKEQDLPELLNLK